MQLWPSTEKQEKEYQNYSDLLRGRPEAVWGIGTEATSNDFSDRCSVSLIWTISRCRLVASFSGPILIGSAPKPSWSIVLELLNSLLYVGVFSLLSLLYWRSRFSRWLPWPSICLCRPIDNLHVCALRAIQMCLVILLPPFDQLISVRQDDPDVIPAHFS